MHEKPKLEQRHNDLEITKEDQEAFEILCRELILSDSKKEILPLSYENREQISVSIQSDLFQYFLNNDPKKELPLEELLDKNKDQDEKQKVIDDFNNSYIDIPVTYDSFAFTAKLAQLAQERKQTQEVPLNCVGNAFLAVVLKKLEGNSVLFGIAADHPILFVTQEDGTQYIDDNNIESIDGAFEQKDGYSLYRTNSDKFNKEHLFFIHNPNIAILHEILHNMQILKEGIKNPDVFLPDTEDTGVKISEHYENILQSGDWEKRRKLICPEVEKSFQENRSEWDLEIERIKNERTRGKKIYISAIKKAKEALGFKDKKMKEFFRFIKPKVQQYKETVGEYFNFLVSEKLNLIPNVPQGETIGDLEDLRRLSHLELQILDSLEHDTIKQEGVRPLTREDILNLIDDTDVQNLIRDLGEVFVDIQDNTDSGYFRQRFTQNMLD